MVLPHPLVPMFAFINLNPGAGCGSVAEILLNLCKATGLIPSTAKGRKEGIQREREREEEETKMNFLKRNQSF